MVTAPFGFAGQAVGFLLTTMMWGCPQKLMPQLGKLGANAGFVAKMGEFMNSWAGQLAMWVVPSFLLSKMFGGDKAKAQGTQQAGQSGQAAQATQAGGKALSQEQVLANGQRFLQEAQKLTEGTMLTPQQLMAQSMPQMAYPQAMRMPQTYA
jgi:hypothetical protein